MGIFAQILDWVGLDTAKSRIDVAEKTYCLSLNPETKTAFKVYAIQAAINKIANALSMSEFQTLKKGKETKEDIWYKLNIEPNVNQNAADFWQKVVFEMVHNPNGALIIQVNGQFIVADDYAVTEYAVRPNYYKNVRAGTLDFTQTGFEEKDVLRLRLNNAKVKEIIDGVYSEYGKLISSSIRNFNRSNSKKIFVKIGTTFQQFESVGVENEDGTVTTKFDFIMDDLFKNRLKSYFEEGDSATPIEEGLDIIEPQSDGGVASAQKKDTRDIANLFNDTVNMVADAFGIPRGLLKGDVADIEAQTDNFITFCINPLANMIEDEANRKLYGQFRMAQGSKLKVMTDLIKTYDATKLAASSEALFRIRAINANDVRRWLRKERIDEPWADEYAMTKNYTDVGKEGSE
jgi:HK97 family phage portal protein